MYWEGLGSTGGGGGPWAGGGHLPPRRVAAWQLPSFPRPLRRAGAASPGGRSPGGWLSAHTPARLPPTRVFRSTPLVLRVTSTCCVTVVGDVTREFPSKELGSEARRWVRRQGGRRATRVTGRGNDVCGVTPSLTMQALQKSCMRPRFQYYRDL